MTIFTETNKFVEANTQELAKDKWLCPLSGKKFRGPDFVRKHIFNKHMDKVDAVRMEVSCAPFTFCYCMAFRKKRERKSSFAQSAPRMALIVPLSWLKFNSVLD